MSPLEKAIQLAVKAHSGQVDKVGQPYILHPLRVMFRLANEIEMTVAVLHDVIEDTEYSFQDLKAMGFSDEIMEALDCVTRRENESYENFIERTKTNAVARKVKCADLLDNMDISRLNEFGDKEIARIKKYVMAWNCLRNISKS